MKPIVWSAVALFMFVPSLMPALAAKGAQPATQPSLTVSCTRTGALFTPGEKLSFTVEGGGPIVWSVSDYYGNTVVADQRLAAPADQSATISLDSSRLPRLGWHQLTVRRGELVGRTTFAIVPPLRDAVPPAESRFGADFAPIGRPDQIPDIAASVRLAGVRWVMMDIPLAHLNPREGVYDWGSAGLNGREPFELMARALHARGVQLMFKTIGQADWISARTTGNVHAYWDPAINLSPPSDYAKWVQVITATVRRFGDICTHWEIGNEPEGHGYFKGTDDEYMKYLEVTAGAIRAAQPNATIVAASMYNGGGVLPRLVKRPDLFDIMSVHYLTGPWGDIAPLSRYLDAMREAGISKVVWNTESRGRGGAGPPSPGESSAMGGKGADNQSPTKAYVRNFAMGIPKVFVFSWNMEEGPAMVHRDYSPQWNTVEYRTMTDQIEGSTFVRELKLGDNLSAFLFRRDGRNLLVAWTDQAGLSSDLSVSAGEALRVVDVMGNAARVEVSGGRATVRLAYQPLFIWGVSDEPDARLP
jgi:hypothetical protein